jgi:signal transduction histidine kinase/CheY-like chemotaxis protein
MRADKSAPRPVRDVVAVAHCSAILNKHPPPSANASRLQGSNPRLRTVSRGFFALVSVALLANLLFLLAINSAFDHARLAALRRDLALDLVDEVHHETDRQARLVRAYTATADARYLLYYYDILAIRQGEKPAPDSADKQYWEHVIAGMRVHQLPTGRAGVPLSERMRRLDFNDAEQQALQDVLEASAVLGKTEQVAFAATQGLYDPHKAQFVSDGKPDPGFARRVVYSADYELQSAQLADKVYELARLTDVRTANEVQTASRRLKGFVKAAIAMDALVGCAVWLAWRGVRRRVLKPIAALAATADRYAHGDYGARMGAAAGRVDELDGLARTLEHMATSIQSDLAERARTQRELEAARAQAESATRAKSLFLANMSHEIRTPLNAIIGMTYLALGTELSAQQRDYLHKVHGASTLLQGLLKDILDLSKIEAGKLVLESVPCYLESLVGDALSLLQRKAADKGLELACEMQGLAQEAEAAVWSDPLRLRQVLMNLLSNAVKFTEHGHVRLRVSLTEGEAHAQTAPASLRIEVEDSGVGMTAEQLALLFQDFTQADSSTTRRYGGTGLGLSISRRLITLMGGTLVARSELGHGSTFTITLPVRLVQQGAPVPLPVVEPFTLAAQDDAAAGRGLVAQLEDPGAGRHPADRPEVTLHACATGAAAHRPLQGLCVLLVDDNPENRQVAGELLARAGATVVTAEDGIKAMDALDALRQAGSACHVVLMDLQMPVMDGYAATQAILSCPAWRELPIVALTAHALMEERLRCLAVGMRGHIAKPLDPQELLRTVLPYVPPMPDAGAGAPALVQPGAPLAVPGLQPAQPADPTPHWERLRALLVDGDSEALEHWRAQRGELMRTLPPAQAHALDHSLQRCDFDAALALLSHTLPAAAARPLPTPTRTT